MLTHAVEAFVSVGANAYSDAIAVEYIRKVAANLRKVVADGQDIEARSQMLDLPTAQAFNVTGLGSTRNWPQFPPDSTPRMDKLCDDVASHDVQHVRPRGQI